MNAYTIFYTILYNEVFRNETEQDVVLTSDLLSTYNTTIEDVIPALINIMQYFIVSEKKEEYRCAPIIQEYKYNKNAIHIKICLEALHIYLKRDCNFKIIYHRNLSSKYDKVEQVTSLLLTKVFENIQQGGFRIPADAMKAMLDVEYNRPSLIETRLIEPAIRNINRCYDDGILLAGCNYSLRRSLVGKGGKIMSYDFKIKDRYLECQMGRDFADNIAKIKAIVHNQFPNYYPIIDYQINEIKDPEFAYNLCKELSNIDQLPDYGHTNDFNLYWNILTFHYGICITKIPDPADLFKIPLRK